MAPILGRTTLVLAPTLLLLLVFTHINSRSSTERAGSLERDLDVKCINGDEFDWSKLPTTHKLNWVPCNDRFECAKLSVPLNYSEPDGRQASIAMIRLPTLVSRDSTEYQGPILFNPGGPGGSGILTVQRQADIFRAIIGPTFDLVGFDPRGVSRSTPNAEFFESAVERVQWKWNRKPLYVANGRLASFLAFTQITTQLAAERDQGKDVLAHINTENTARDMLRIVEAHGFEKLQYWGVSYGSVLGSVFSTIFPDKVGRVIIDAIVDMEEYFAGVWESNLMDTDASWAQFASGCQKAGPIRCPLFAPTHQEIVDRVDNITKQVTIKPVPVKTDTQYGIVNYDAIRKVIFTSLYDPYATFLKLAQGLADLENGDGAKILEMAQGPRFECPSCSTPRAPPPEFSEASTTIFCNDARVPSNGTFEYAEEHLARLLEASQFGDMWAAIALSCNGWPKFPKAFGGPVGGNTSFPLLIIGNTADPVTPLWAAKKVARSFPYSVLLTQNSSGHTALAAVSACTFKHVGEYFRNGTLPAANTICEVDIDLFPSEGTTALDYEDKAQGVLRDEDQRMEKVKLLIREKWMNKLDRHSLPLSPMF